MSYAYTSFFNQLMPYFLNPVVTYSLIAMLFCGLMLVVLSFGAPANGIRSSGEKAVQSALGTGFVMAFFVVLLGFGWQYLNQKYIHSTVSGSITESLKNPASASISGRPLKKANLTVSKSKRNR